MSSSPWPVIHLKPRKAQPFFNRHPWVYAGTIGKTLGNPQPGDAVVVRSAEGQFIAYGLFNPASNITVRLYSWDESQPLTDDYWHQLLQRAVRLRQSLFRDGTTTAYRLIFSEADGLSGLTVDRYDDWLLVQLTSRALADRQKLIFDWLEANLQPCGIWLRTEKGIAAVEGLQITDGLVRGDAPPRPLTVRENGLTCLVDVAEGQKTGAFLDQRDNRLAAARFAEGKRVLDLFCYAGGFGIHAAQHGATSVTCVDSSQPALDVARANAEANSVADRISFVRADVFQFLEQAQAQTERYDLVVLDPPKMARQQAGMAQAMRGYHSLNELSAKLVVPGGILVTCSCSGRVTRQDFEMMLANVATSLRRPIQILDVRGQPPDHPVSPNCPENAYLKCYVCRVV